MRHFLLISLLMLPGCAVMAPEPPSALPLFGQVSFPTERSAQADLNDVAVSATVSLIRADTNETVHTALTDQNRKFVFSFVKWQPTVDALYYLEALKGLGSNQAGNAVIRIRTLAQYTATGWRSLGASGSGVQLTAGTTAVTIVASHLGPAQVPPLGLLGKMTIGVPDPSLVPTTPDTLDPTGTGISNAQYHAVYDLVARALDRDADPLERVSYNGSTFAMKAYAVPGISAVVPSAAAIGATVTLQGSNFDAVPANNTVFFNGVPAIPATGSATQLVVTVPAGATSGPVSVTTGAGPAGVTQNFSVIQPPSGVLTAL
ncbi:IPT/TIG domain-containing protein [bacterium]|nr:IPT/TIG domain-containing protein [bacterium]